MEKKKYEKPEIILERFVLNEGIAACAKVVSFGPEDDASVCGNYGFGGADVQPFSLDIVPFYDTYTCECYTTAPKDSGYFGKS